MVEFPEASGDQLIAAVVGKPIAHSLSPLIHNTAFKQENLNWVYHAIEVMEEETTECISRSKRKISEAYL